MFGCWNCQCFIIKFCKTDQFRKYLFICLINIKLPCVRKSNLILNFIMRVVNFILQIYDFLRYLLIFFILYHFRRWLPF